MFWKCHPGEALSKEDYEAVIDGLRDRIGVLQREFRDRKIPVIIVFEGWRFSGISDTINRLTYALDPRGCRVHMTRGPNDLERAHVPLWRFWADTPARGQMVIFDRSWYTDTVLRNSRGKKGLKIPRQDLADIITMEEQLSDDGTVIIKFFLHISKKEQKNRVQAIKKEHPELVSNNPTLKNLQDDPGAVSELERMLTETSTPKAPWAIVEATDRRFTIVTVFTTIITSMEARLKDAASTGKTVSGKGKKARPVDKETPVIDAMNLSLALTEEDYTRRFARCEERLHELQYSIHKNRIPVVLVFEGCDAAGKGGAIIRVDRALNPRCSVVEPVAAPTPDEKSHHYLWRFIRNLPKAGNITIFDRSWYGRVLVERVEGFCTEPEWRRAYGEINAMEDYLVRSGMVVMKFWLQIDQDTQLERFLEREKDPLKKYKITDEDWRNREKWDQYRIAIEEMLMRTNTPTAPWTLVESNNKYYARIKIMDAVVAGIEMAVSHAGKKNRKRS
ncbi:polyphosphate:AMP phosphotransferase [Methanoregula sp.]|uniref:polyphosphate:AMP phosphotransferase n=1 Tax=Methanoregula sp. TaxID=2052170 RepID=UPI003563D52F